MPRRCFRIPVPCLLSAIALMLVASIAQATTLSGWKPPTDGFSDSTISASARLADIAGARISLGLACNTDKYASGLDASMTISGSTFDVETSSDVHSTINFFGPNQVYTTESRAVSVKARWDNARPGEMNLSGGNSHQVDFSIPFDTRGDAYVVPGTRLLLGFSINGNPETLAFSFADPALRKFTAACLAANEQRAAQDAATARAEAEQEAKEEAARKAQEAAEALQHQQEFQAALARQQAETAALRDACSAGQPLRIVNGPTQLTHQQGARTMDPYLYNGQIVQPLPGEGASPLLDGDSCHVQYTVGHSSIFGDAALRNLTRLSPAEIAALPPRPPGRPPANYTTIIGSSRWAGQFVYTNGQAPGNFTLTLETGSDGRLSGTAQEPGPPLASSTISGKANGPQLYWVKSYSEAHKVDYEGQLSDGGTQIEGIWTMAGGSGSFEMHREP